MNLNLNRKIKTLFLHPPIPFRYFDWIAFYEDEDGEENMVHAFGYSEEESVENLKNEEP